jgi:hypothetical protein
MSFLAKKTRSLKNFKHIDSKNLLKMENNFNNISKSELVSEKAFEKSLNITKSERNAEIDYKTLDGNNNSMMISNESSNQSNLSNLQSDFYLSELKILKTEPFLEAKERSKNNSKFENYSKNDSSKIKKQSEAEINSCIQHNRNESIKTFENDPIMINISENNNLNNSYAENSSSIENLIRNWDKFTKINDIIESLESFNLLNIDDSKSNKLFTIRNKVFKDMNEQFIEYFMNEPNILKRKIRNPFEVILFVEDYIKNDISFKYVDLYLVIIALKVILKNYANESSTQNIFQVRSLIFFV